MFFRTVSRWMFCSLGLMCSTALAESSRSAAQKRSNISEFEPMQAAPKLPRFVLDACRTHTEGEACSVEFQRQKLARTCKKIPDHEELVCLPAGPPANHRSA